MFKPKLSVEERIAQEAEKRAARGKARLERMKNQAQWNKGFHDDDILKQQEERIQKKQNERTDEINYSTQILKMAEESKEQENRRLLEKQQKARLEAEALRKLDPKSRDTWDLNNPHALRDSKLPREGDEDVPVSSLQKFDGEDLDFSKRKHGDQQMMKSRLEDQMSDHQKLKNLEKQQDREYAQLVKQQVEHLTRIENAKKESSQKYSKEVGEQNINFANEKREERERLKAKFQEEAAKDIETTKSSTLLSEKMEDTLRIDNTNRYIPYAFKGYTVEKTKDFYNQRIEQALESVNKRDAEKAEEKDYAGQEAAKRRHLLKIEMERKQEKIRKTKEYAQELQKQAMEQKKALEKRNEEFKNEVTDQFFSQFGNSHR